MKGQIQMGELIMVAIIVVLLLVLGIAGYSIFKGGEIQEKTREFTSQGVVELAQEAAAMPEIACAYAKSPPEECIDLYRLNHTVRMINNSAPNSRLYNYYRSKFGSALIQVKEVYPKERKWTLYNQTAENRSQLPVQIPVYLYNPVEKKSGFGVMTVVRYS